MDEDEIKNFIEQAKNGNEEAKEFIINCNMKYINKIVRIICLKNKNLSKEDLVQDGIIAVIKAIRSYDVSKNIKFSTYAYSIIQCSLTSKIKNKYTFIKIPEHMVSKVIKFNKNNDSDDKELERISNLNNVLSLNKEFLEEDSFFINNLKYEEKKFNDLEWEDTFQKILTPLEEKVIKEYFIENKSIEMIEKELNISKRKISNTKYYALKKLKNELKEKL